MAEILTEHPHVVLVESALGPEPHIRGTGIAVRHVINKLKGGSDVSDILQAHPHLTTAQVYDALSYYYDHQEQVEGFIRLNTEEAWREKGLSQADDPKRPA